MAIPGATQNQYTVLQSGTYHATVFSFVGCQMTTIDKDILIYDAPTAGFTINSNNQCFKNNQFIFTNTSSIATGNLQYDWNLGDNTTASTLDVTRKFYTTSGTYIVKLIVTSDNGCKDSISFTVNVFASPVAGFTVNTNEQCFKNNQFVFTIPAH